MVVLRDNVYYRIPCADATGRPLPTATVRRQLVQILQQRPTDAAQPSPAIGALTGGNRDRWATVRSVRLRGPHRGACQPAAPPCRSPVQARAALAAADKRNADLLRMIDLAMMVVVLERAPAPTADAQLLRLLGQASDRWYDRHQLIVFANGDAGFVFEHSIGDGSTALRMAIDVQRRAGTGESASDGSGDAACVQESVRPHFWHNVPAAVADAARESQAELEAARRDIDLHVLNCDAVSTASAKAASLSADSMVQVAMQLAYHRMHGHFVAYGRARVAAAAARSDR